MATRRLDGIIRKRISEKHARDGFGLKRFWGLCGLFLGGQCLKDRPVTGKPLLRLKPTKLEPRWYVRGTSDLRQHRAIRYSTNLATNGGLFI